MDLQPNVPLCRSNFISSFTFKKKKITGSTLATKSPLGSHQLDRQKDSRASRRQGDVGENITRRILSQTFRLRDVITASRDGANEHAEDREERTARIYHT